MSVTNEETDGANMPIGRGFHLRTETRPAEFAHGPLTGASLKRLAAVVCPLFDQGKDSRNLHKLAAIPAIWVEQWSPHLLKIYFASAQEFKDAATAYSRLRGEG